METQERSSLAVINGRILQDKRLSALEKLVYARIAYFEEFFEDTKNTAEILGASVYSVQKAKRHLEMLGYIHCTKNTGRGKRYKADVAIGLDLAKNKVCSADSPTQSLQNATSDLAIRQLRVCKSDDIIKKENRTNKELLEERKKERKKTLEQVLDQEIEDEELKALLREHLKMRALNRWPKLTDRAFEMNLHKLMNQAGGDPETAKEIVRQSLQNGWRGFFPVKGAAAPPRPADTAAVAPVSAYYEERPGEDVSWKRVFKEWEQKLGIRPEATVANVEGAKNLLRQDGDEKVATMISALAMRQKTGYLTKEIKAICDPAGLWKQRMLVWAFYLENRDDWEWKFGRPGKEPWEL